MKWKECTNPNKGISCIHSEDAEYTVICPLDKCQYKKLDYKSMMQSAKDVDINKCK